VLTSSVLLLCSLFCMLQAGVTVRRESQGATLAGRQFCTTASLLVCTDALQNFVPCCVLFLSFLQAGVSLRRESLGATLAGRQFCPTAMIVVLSDSV
jgi:hypothetical protein